MGADPFAVSDVELNAAVTAAPALNLTNVGKAVNDQLAYLTTRISDQLAVIKSVDGSPAQLELLRNLMYQKKVLLDKKTTLGV